MFIQTHQPYLFASSGFPASYRSKCCMNKVQSEIDNLLTLDKPIDIAGLTTVNWRVRVGSLN
jgi:hypothetical protein